MLRRKHFSEAAGGSSPMEHADGLRIEMAKALLETTKLPAESVAAKVGFGCLDAFIRIFVRRTGTTPDGYRGRLSGGAGEGGQQE